jgi:hypothetical protein
LTSCWAGFCGLHLPAAGVFPEHAVGGVLFFATRRLLPVTQARGGRLELTGPLTSTVAMAALICGIVGVAEIGWHHPETQGAIRTRAFILALFWLVQARIARRLPPLRLFADIAQAGAYAARMRFIEAMVRVFVFATQLMQVALDVTRFEAGLGFLPMTLATLAAALPVPRLSRRYGNASVWPRRFLRRWAGWRGWRSRGGQRLSSRYGLAAGALGPWVWRGAGDLDRL